MSDLAAIFTHFPVIQLDDKIILRQIVPTEDYQHYFNYIRTAQVAAFLSNEDLPATPENAVVELNYWSSLFIYRSCFYWAISLIENNQIIGTCGFNNWNKSQLRGEISYDLDYNYWNQGLMTKAIKAIVDFGVQEMKLQRIQATVAFDNLPSAKMLEKVGFKQESLLQNYGVLHGVSKDFFMYAYTQN